MNLRTIHKRKSISKNDENRIDEIFGDHMLSLYPPGKTKNIKAFELRAVILDVKDKQLKRPVVYYSLSTGLQVCLQRVIQRKHCSLLR